METTTDPVTAAQAGGPPPRPLDQLLPRSSKASLVVQVARYEQSKSNPANSYLMLKLIPPDDHNLVDINGERIDSEYACWDRVMQLGSNTEKENDREIEQVIWSAFRTAKGQSPPYSAQQVRNDPSVLVGKTVTGLMKIEPGTERYPDEKNSVSKYI